MADAVEPAHPRWLAAAWKLNPSARSAPDQGLSVARIVTAGVDLADEDGIAGLSIRKLAQRLGVGTMAAYRHIDSKEELIILMIDAALGAPTAELAETSGFVEGLSRWAREMSTRYAEHPWLLDAPIVGIPATPNRALWFEHLLRPFADTGLELQQMLDSALLIDGHARNVAYLVREIAGHSDAAARATGAWLVPLLDPERFPVLSRVMATGALEDDTEQNVDFGLERIIAGIEDFIRDEAG